MPIMYEMHAFGTPHLGLAEHQGGGVGLGLGHQQQLVDNVAAL